MIGFTKLLCGKATVSEALRQNTGGAHRQSHLLQFTTADRPLVVWNMTSACNLRCAHCYNASGERAPAQELTTAEAEVFLDDLAEMGAPVLLFSGGEPVLRPDLFHLGAYAATPGRAAGAVHERHADYPEVADRLEEASFQYVGVSIDGERETHDRFRGAHGARTPRPGEGFAQGAGGGLRTGVRFTVSQENVEDLPAVLQQCVEEGVARFCLYHLVYAGRGAEWRRAT